MGGVRWRDTDNKEPCYPKFNALGYYIGRSKVDGIHPAYETASEEIITIYNDLSNKIKALQAENKSLTKGDKSANVKVETPKIMAGKKGKYLHAVEVEKAKRMRADNVSFEDIAKVFGVSSRTVRRAVNGQLAYNEVKDKNVHNL